MNPPMTLTSARLAHLRNAAFALQRDGPTFAAICGLELVEQREAAREKVSGIEEGFCPCCGSVLVPGRSCAAVQDEACALSRAGRSQTPSGRRRRHVSPRASPDAANRPSTANPSAVSFICARCHRRIRSTGNRSTQRTQTSRPHHAALHTHDKDREASPRIDSSDVTTIGEASKDANSPFAALQSFTAQEPHRHHSAKRRQRSKHQSAIQSLLAKTETASAGRQSHRLDLMDFMNKS